jgi:hypothetical protein
MGASEESPLMAVNDDPAIIKGRTHRRPVREPMPSQISAAEATT